MSDLWQLGLALGLAVDAGLLLGLVLSGAPVRLPDDLGRLATIGAAIAALGWTGLPVAVTAFRAAVGAVVSWDTWQRRNDAPTEVPAVPVLAIVPDLEDANRAWRGAVETFLLAGDSGGFSIRRMAGVAGSDTWAQLTTWLAECGLLANFPGRGYDWAEGMTLARALTKLRADALPYPDGPAPVVNWSYNDAALRNGKQRATTGVKPASQAVIDN